MIKILTVEGITHEAIIQHLARKTQEWTQDNCDATITRTQLSETAIILDSLPSYTAALLIEYETPETLYVPLGNGLYVRRDHIVTAARADDGRLQVTTADQDWPLSVIGNENQMNVLQMVGAIR